MSPSFPRRSRPHLLTAMLAAVLPFAAIPALATPFSIMANSTTAQTLGTGSGQTGFVAAGRSLTLAGSTVAVTISGNNATLNNEGTIAQTGSGRAIRDNTGVSNLVINNGSATNAGAIMRTADADVIQMNVAASSATLNNYGAMFSLNASAGGAQAVDFSVMTGANTVNNFAGGVMTASEADAVRPGRNGVVNNAGTIRSATNSGSSSDGVDGQSNSGITFNNAGTGIVDGGRHGITAGQSNSATAFVMSIVNHVGGLIQGSNGSGVNLDGFNAQQLVSVTNHGTIVGRGVTGDGDGVDVDGMVNILNTGIIRSANAFSAPAGGMAFSEAISAGGGTIVNAGTIEGLVAAGNTNAVGRGITLAGNDITSGALAGTREGIYGNAVITNQAGGLIRGGSDSAIVAQSAASGFTVTVNNQTGATILGGGATSAAIRTGADSTTIRNAGIINGASSGKAIEMGSANNTLVISGGQAAIIGSINGGNGGGTGGKNTMTVDAGQGNRFAYAGAISNFGTVEIKSGDVILSGQSSYAGDTVLSGGKLILDGANRLSSDSALRLRGGDLSLVGAGDEGQVFASLFLEESTVIDLGLSTLTFKELGGVIDGEFLTLTNASTGYAIRFLGDYSNDARFLQLMRLSTINSMAAAFRFDGQFTDLIVAVPEPASIALLLLGLGLMGVTVRHGKPGRG